MFLIFVFFFYLMQLHFEISGGVFIYAYFPFVSFPDTERWLIPSGRVITIWGKRTENNSLVSVNFRFRNILR